MLFCQFNESIFFSVACCATLCKWWKTVKVAWQDFDLWPRCSCNFGCTAFYPSYHNKPMYGLLTDQMGDISSNECLLAPKQEHWFGVWHPTKDIDFSQPILQPVPKPLVQALPWIKSAISDLQLTLNNLQSSPVTMANKINNLFCLLLLTQMLKQ